MLFLDLECVPEQRSFFDLSEDMQQLREKKAEKLAEYAGMPDATPDELYDNRSGIYAEWGKVIVISVGYLKKNDAGDIELHIKSFSGDDEKAVLLEFFELLNSEYDKSFHQLCGHNIKEFDVPYICRRATIHGLELPSIIDTAGKKPREVNHIDTMELWKFGDRKNYTSLDLLCRVMGIETPKDDISGEQVARVYRDDKDLPRIQTYCEKDVIATTELLLKFMRKDRDITVVNE